MGISPEEQQQQYEAGRPGRCRMERKLEMLHHRKGIALGTSRSGCCRASPTSSGFDFLIACGEICVVLEQRAGSKSRSDRVSVCSGFVLDWLADRRFLFFSAFASLDW